MGAEILAHNRRNRQMLKERMDDMRREITSLRSWPKTALAVRRGHSRAHRHHHMSRELYLIDGYSVIYRGYFAFLNRPLLNPLGQNSSSVFVFFRTLFQVMRDRAPETIAVAMDSRVPTFRHLRYEAYKATRDKAPEDLHAQVPVIEEILEALGIPCLSADGFEADDVIATLAEGCRATGAPVLDPLG